MSVAVLIISYNTRGMTLGCLRSVFGGDGRTSMRVIVVDNASTDGSADAIEAEFEGRVELERLEKNIGFAAGNNAAARHATEDWLLLLNPDTVVLDNAIDKLLGFAEAHPDRGIYGGRTVFADGSPNPKSCWMRATPWSLFCQAVGLSRFRSSRLLNPEQPDAWAGARPERVDIVSGCFLLIRREMWERLEGFDEDFFMYGEEADLCLRAGRVGAKPSVTDAATIIHHGGASERVRAGKLVRLLDAKHRLCKRHWSVPWLAGPCIALWPLCRLIAYSIVSLFKPSARAERETWRTVWRQRRRWLAGRGGVDAAEGMN